MGERGKVAEHCICGGSMTGAIVPSAGAAGLAEVFWSVHSGNGHGPATAEQARRARRRHGGEATDADC